MIAEAFIAELNQEAGTTRRVLERVPDDKLTWKPHEKSLTLGQLAWHISVLPHAIADLLSELERQAPNIPRPQPASVKECLAAFDESVPYASGKLASWGDAGLQAIWKLSLNGKTISEIPRGAAVRSIMMNHAYHHRGQLTVYLRLLDVPIPVVYGPTADENPFL